MRETEQSSGEAGQLVDTLAMAWFFTALVTTMLGPLVAILIDSRLGYTGDGYLNEILGFVEIFGLPIIYPQTPGFAIALAPVTLLTAAILMQMLRGMPLGEPENDSTGVTRDGE